MFCDFRKVESDMKKFLNSQNKVTVLNIMSTFMLQGIVFLSTPIFTRMLGNAQFGVYSVFNSWVLILTCVMGFCMHASIGTGMYNFKNDYLKFRNNVLLCSTIIALGEVVIFVVLGRFFANLLGYTPWLVVLLVLSAFSHYIVTFVQSSYVYEKKADMNLILSVSVSVFTVGLSIVLIYFSKPEQKYMGRVYGTVIPYLIIAVIVWLITFLKKPVKLEKIYCVFGISVGFPIIFHSLSQNILTQSSRVIMQFFNVSDSEIGIYSAFFTITAALTTILNALNTSWCPFYYDDLEKENYDILKRKCRNYIELVSVLSVGFILLAREVSYVMVDESYYSGMNIIPIMVFSIFFTFMYQFPVNFEFYNKKTKVIARGTIISGIVNIILNFMLIPKFGIYGAAVGTAISYFVLFLMHFFIVIKMTDGHFHLKVKEFFPGICLIVTASLLFYFLSDFWFVRWALGVTIGIFEMYRVLKRKSIF